MDLHTIAGEKVQLGTRYLTVCDRHSDPSYRVGRSTVKRALGRFRRGRDVRIRPLFLPTKIRSFMTFEVSKDNEAIYVGCVGFDAGAVETIRGWATKA